MTQRVVSPAIGRKSSEPLVALTSNGTAFFDSSGVDTPGNYYQRTKIFRSRNLGRTWQDVTPQLAAYEVPPFTQDPFVVADPVTDRVFSLDLRVDQQCSWLSWTDDEGASWTFSPSVCNSNPPVEDHQMLFVGPATKTDMGDYPNILYYCANDIWVSFSCVRSLDGGQTFDTATKHTESNPDPSCSPYLATGHGAASFADGTAYVPWGYCDRTYVTVSRDDGQTWETVVVDKKMGVSRQPFEAHEARVAVDRMGNAYIFWIGHSGLPYLSISRDQGRSWSRPQSVAAPGVTATRYPSITAGSEGRIALSYYGTDVKRGFDASTKAMNHAVWHSWTGFSLGALKNDPVFASTTSNPYGDPVRRGSCDGRCPDDADDDIGGGVYDFLGTHVHPVTGRVWMSIVDVCNDKCGRPSGKPSHPAIPRGAVGVQIGGSFLGHPIPSRPEPRRGSVAGVWL